VADLRLAKVVATHPESHSVDLVFCDNGARVPNVPVMSGSASTNSGTVDLPTPTAPKEAYDPQDTKDRDIYAYVGFANGLPVVIGFKVPEVGQMTFKEENRRITRHASDVYTTLDGKGNFEMFHPSGTYFRIGEEPEHEDLAGKDFDGKWEIKNNTDVPIHVHLSVANKGTETASISIDPDGNIKIKHEGDLSLTTAGSMSMEVTGDITSSAATWSHTGAMSVKGNFKVTSGDVTADGVSLKTHKHGGVQTGGGTTGAPV